MLLFNGFAAQASINKSELTQIKKIVNELQKSRQQKNEKIHQHPNSYLLRKGYKYRKATNQSFKGAYNPIDQKPFFDIPVTYNSNVRAWIKYYQTRGRRWFKTRLERSYKYLPVMKKTLAKKGLPQDLAYIAMIESGFSAHATSHAKAVGYWQFIPATAKRYGLHINWWIDERRDFLKSTLAAANYLGDLYKMFGSWYLTAAAYNMGENRLRRLIHKYKTYNFWKLADSDHLPQETSEYIPKMIASLLISKAPKLYGFKHLNPLHPMSYEYIYVPGGTDLYNMSNYLQVDRAHLNRLNPDLIQGFVPGFVTYHRIRIPKGYNRKVASYIKTQL